MEKFLRFNTANGIRLLNVEACAIVKVAAADEVHFLYVPTNTTGIASVRKLTRVPATGLAFNANLGEITTYINNAIIKASNTSYTKAIVDVDIPAKYALEDLIFTGP